MLLILFEELLNPGKRSKKKDQVAGNGGHWRRVVLPLIFLLAYKNDEAEQ